MIYPEKSPAAWQYRFFAILLAVAGILATVFAIRGPDDRQSGRVWVFQKPETAASTYVGLGVDRPR